MGGAFRAGCFQEVGARLLGRVFWGSGSRVAITFFLTLYRGKQINQRRKFLSGRSIRTGCFQEVGASFVLQFNCLQQAIPCIESMPTLFASGTPD